MAVTYMSSIRGCNDMKQVSVNIASGEENDYLYVPVMPAETFEGYLVGPLGLTFPEASAQTQQPMPETDAICLYRLIPVSTSSVDLILRSVGPDGTVHHTSPVFPLTSPSPLGVSDDIPLFECLPGDRLAISGDAICTFMAIVGVKGQFGK